MPTIVQDLDRLAELKQMEKNALEQLQLSAPREFEVWKETTQAVITAKEKIKDRLVYVYPPHNIKGKLGMQAVWISKGPWNSEKITELFKRLIQFVNGMFHVLQQTYNLPELEIRKIQDSLNLYVNELDSCRGEGYYQIR